MEIHNHGNNPRLHINVNQANQEVAKTESEANVERSPEVRSQQLLERLEGDAKVRERLLVEVKAKVQAGKYLTRAAAEEAAQRMVD